MTACIITTRDHTGVNFDVMTSTGNRYALASVFKITGQARPFHAHGHDGRTWVTVGAFRLRREAMAAAMDHAERFANLIDLGDAMRVRAA
jgi:hypothetical protein